ncbi:hypothetical protein B0T21DRAFT_344952 [Apiosordaria backusii]|uniref:Uncharacterized protein n=1 Tax=Apiosordaria backusii TaxID=314023 RepID=A0AA40ESY9_9PEZI|nr:hypothetical protein B0T21DRAFT_344952 [Apiosordaria backusii]
MGSLRGSKFTPLPNSRIAKVLDSLILIGLVVLPALYGGIYLIIPERTARYALLGAAIIGVGGTYGMMMGSPRSVVPDDTAKQSVSGTSPTARANQPIGKVQP